MNPEIINEGHLQDGLVSLCESELHEFQLVEGLQDEEKFFYIRGKFATIEQINNNKRIYPRALWEREVAKYQTQIENGTINTLMEWEHPKGRLTVDPKNAVAKITKLWIEGDYVMGEAVIFDTPQAETIKSMIRHGVKISVSSRASGNVGPDRVVKEFNLITFDIVTNPSDQSATMSGVFESEEDEAIHTTENLEDNEMADKALMENLVGILRSKNVEIQDLNEEIELLRDQIRNFELGVGRTDAPYGNDGARGFRPEDDEYDRYAEERREYTLRDVLRGYRDIGDYRHQDVNATVVDNDPSGYYASGEEEAPRVLDLLRNAGRDDFVGSTLGADVQTDDKPGMAGEVKDTPAPAQTGREGERGVQVPVIGAPINESKASIKNEVSRLSSVFGVKPKLISMDKNEAYYQITASEYKKIIDEFEDQDEDPEAFNLMGLYPSSKSKSIEFTTEDEDSITFGISAVNESIESAESMNESTEAPKGNRFLQVPAHMI